MAFEGVKNASSRCAQGFEAAFKQMHKSSIQQGMREVLSSQRSPNPQAMLYWEVLQQSTLIHLLVELLQNSRHETAENDIGERITGPRAQMGRGLIFLGRELEERVGMQCPDSSDKVHRQSSFQ